MQQGEHWTLTYLRGKTVKYVHVRAQDLNQAKRRAWDVVLQTFGAQGVRYVSGRRS